MRRLPMTLPLLALVACLPAQARAQWDPDNGRWRESDANHLRVMTWNVQDSLCSSSDRKREQGGDWHAIVCIVASLRPDVLLLQETGDNSGNGTGSGVDPVDDLAATIDLFLHGGTDPFEGGEVTSYVRKYAPDYDLPYVFVSSGNDGFNRNIILSRYPFADLNGDTKTRISDIFFVAPDEWAPGGNGGIRGFMFAELDLPDETYPGDAVVGNAHLKAGGASDDHDERIRAAKNVGYFVYYLFAGAGAGTPDPNGKIGDSPQAASVLPPVTPVILGGDWNEDEQRNGGAVGPADWLRQGGSPGGSDGTDLDSSDAVYDSAVEYFTGDRTTQSSSKLDYIAWWDSVASQVRSFVFRTSAIPGGKFPPELYNYPTPENPNPLLASNTASDHRPVIVDLELPVHTQSAPGPFALISPADGASEVGRESLLDWEDASLAESYSLVVATDLGLADRVLEIDGILESQHQLSGPTLEPCATYYWGVLAHNSAGQTGSTPYPAEFHTAGVADFNGDGGINTLDFLLFLNQWNARDPATDLNLDGAINSLDFLFFLNAYTSGC
ncbi:MAG TPA: GC-type dockerin domain-anchored protein [Phycisphaerales bacterium]|nr:GC-type dockerin domain-anchored protein [Phycisphaerales bacterium]